MESEIYLLGKKIRKMAKKLREKQKFWYRDSVTIQMT